MPEASFFNTVVNTSIAFRKLDHITVEQEHGPPFPLRARQHIFVCQPFGTGKSHGLFKPLKKALGDDVVIEDQFTLAAFLGSIDDKRHYLPGLVTEIGGKILIIDEFNNLNEDSRMSLLSVLENDEFSRKLARGTSGKQEGFKDEYTNIQVDKKGIHGEVKTTCIAGAMYFPKVREDKIREEAILSRFLPYFRTFTVEDLSDMSSGRTYTKYEDTCIPTLKEITLKKDAVTPFHKAYWDWAKKQVKVEHYQNGFLQRTWTALLRLAAADVAIATQPKKKLEITKPGELMLDWEYRAHNLLCNYIHKDSKNNLERFEIEWTENPSQDWRFYSQKLGVGRRSIFIYAKRLGKALSCSSQEDEEELKSI